MTSTETDLQNQALDTIIAKRRTHREFSSQPVPDALIREIINAGLHAPYAGATLPGEEEYFRRFFVIRKDSETMKIIQPLLFHEIREMATELEKAAGRNDEFGDLAGGFIRRLARIVQDGKVPGVGTAPFFVVIAEKKGFPPLEQASIAHCLENMWLKATALGLGFQPVSITSQMDGIEEFCEIFQLRTGRWGLTGCAIGYPAAQLPPSERPDPEEVTTWLA